MWCAGDVPARRSKPEMRQIIQGFRPMMRRALILAAMLAIVAIPMAVGNVGFCRSMPCCPPHLGTHIADAHQPDCCNTTNCAQAPPAGREYTKQADSHPPLFMPFAILPTVQTLTARPDAPPSVIVSVGPQTVHRRIALLSIL